MNGEEARRKEQGERVYVPVVTPRYIDRSKYRYVRTTVYRY